MLFVWVFALLSGFANACLTKPRDASTHTVSNAPAAHDPQRAQRHEPSYAKTVHGLLARGDAAPAGPADKAPCLKACDETSQTLLKQAPKGDPADPQPTALPDVRRRSLLLLATDAAGRVFAGEADRPWRPLRVQFSRLIL